MLDASLELAENCDIFIGAAAVCDYTVKTYAVEKIKKSDKINLELIPTADILKTLRTKFPKLFIVGFAAETNNIIEYAKEKLINKKLNLIVANDVSNNKVFHQDNNEVTIVNRDFVEFASGSASKDIIAKFILQHVNNEYFKS
jgi:phosphopantothenoylcysteine decarboxylase / phosphopantothenate---cysteine ligase